MDEGELTDRLRRGLRARAEAIQPSEAELPLPPSQRHGTADTHRAALTGVAAAALVAAVAVAVVVVAPTRSSQRLKVTGPIPGSTLARPPATVQTPSSPPVAANPGPTTTGPGRPAVGRDDDPLFPTVNAPTSVTFVSAEDGWVSASVPCGGTDCMAVASTTDGGVTWHQAPAPPLTGGGLFEVRFGDLDDGWAWDDGGTELWVTHDRGKTWNEDNPIVGAWIGDLEASGGRAQLVVLDDTDPATSLAWRIFTVVFASSDWVESPTGLPIGAGPVPSIEMVLHGAAGWIISLDRIVVGGAELTGTGAWVDWSSPPCDGNSGELAPSSVSILYATCQEDVWGPPQPGTAVGTTWLYRSDNGGDSFFLVGELPNQGGNDGGYGIVTTSPGDPDHLLAGVGPGIQASDDGGLRWHPVESTATVEFFGFTTATQVEALSLAANGTSEILVSRNAGATWDPVSF